MGLGLFCMAIECDSLPPPLPSSMLKRVLGVFGECYWLMGIEMFGSCFVTVAIEKGPTPTQSEVLMGMGTKGDTPTL